MNFPVRLAERPLNRLLKMAVLAGVETAVLMHIRRGDNLDARDGDGMTPLMIAALKNKAGICKLLLAPGADPALTDSSGRDALGIAKAVGAMGAAAVLVADNGSKAEVPGLIDSEPAHHASTTKYPKNHCGGVTAVEAK